MSAAEGLSALLRLYRSVLRVHREKLPGALRGLGDACVALAARCILPPLPPPRRSRRR